jgi:CheY-like chemotaxis protein
MHDEEKMENYLSSVRHDLRSQLVVVREGTSMVLDGIGNEDCNNCFALLRPVLECTDELNKLIGELLSSARIKGLLTSDPNTKEEEQRNAKKESIGNELERFKHELTAMISHVIRTPLTVVKESLSLVLDEIPGRLNAQQKELLSTGRENLDGLIQSIEEVFERSWDDIMRPSRSGPPAETIPAKESAGPKKRILIIEDQAAIVNMLRMRLEANHYEVITAGDGQEGLEKARQENPSLIILDVMLPKLNGYKVCQLLKADPKYRTIPIIVSSGRTPREIRKVSKEVGAEAYLPKPFEAEALLSKMKELLAKKGK